MDTLAINGQDITVKEYMGQRVVTFKEIDRVHNRPDGTARKRFCENKHRFIEGTDFFKIMPVNRSFDFCDTLAKIFLKKGLTCCP